MEAVNERPDVCFLLITWKPFALCPFVSARHIKVSSGLICVMRPFCTNKHFPSCVSALHDGEKVNLGSQDNI